MSKTNCVQILSGVISFVWNYRINSEQNKFNCLKAFLVCSSYHIFLAWIFAHKPPLTQLN